MNTTTGKNGNSNSNSNSNTITIDPNNNNPHVWNATKWYFVGEGGKHALFASRSCNSANTNTTSTGTDDDKNCQRLLLLRVRKHNLAYSSTLVVLHQDKDEDDEVDEMMMLDSNSNSNSNDNNDECNDNDNNDIDININYINYIVRPKLGKEYVDVPTTIVNLNWKFLHELRSKTLEQSQSLEFSSNNTKKPPKSQSLRTPLRLKDWYPKVKVPPPSFVVPPPPRGMILVDYKQLVLPTELKFEIIEKIDDEEEEDDAEEGQRQRQQEQDDTCTTTSTPTPTTTTTTISFEIKPKGGYVAYSPFVDVQVHTNNSDNNTNHHHHLLPPLEQQTKQQSQEESSSKPLLLLPMKYKQTRYALLQQLYTMGYIEKGWIQAEKTKTINNNNNNNNNNTTNNYSSNNTNNTNSDSSSFRISSYNPLDMFSNDTTRIKHSIIQLFQNPQNNMKVYVNGKMMILMQQEIGYYGDGDGLGVNGRKRNEVDVIFVGDDGRDGDSDSDSNCNKNNNNNEDEEEGGMNHQEEPQQDDITYTNLLKSLFFPKIRPSNSSTATSTTTTSDFCPTFQRKRRTSATTAAAETEESETKAATSSSNDDDNEDLYDILSDIVATILSSSSSSSNDHIDGNTMPLLQRILHLQQELDVLDGDGAVLIYNHLVSKFYNGSQQHAEKDIDTYNYDSYISPASGTKNPCSRSSTIKLLSISPFPFPTSSSNYDNNNNNVAFDDGVTKRRTTPTTTTLEKLCIQIEKFRQLLPDRSRNHTIPADGTCSRNVVAQDCNGDASPTILPLTDEMERIRKESLRLVDSLPREECIYLLQNWLLSLAMCDVSIFVTIRYLGEDLDHALLLLGIDNNQQQKQQQQEYHDDNVSQREEATEGSSNSSRTSIVKTMTVNHPGLLRWTDCQSGVSKYFAYIVKTIDYDPKPAKKLRSRHKKEVVFRYLQSSPTG